MLRIQKLLASSPLKLAKLQLLKNVRFFSQYPTETISYDDLKRFPSELGPIQKSIYGDKLVLPKCRVDQYVWANSGLWQNQTAVACGVTGKSYTYAQLRDRCASFALNLQKLGVKKGDVVAISMVNSPDFVVAALGGLEAGCVLTTANPMYNPNELANQLLQTKAKIVTCFVENYVTVQKAVAITKLDIKIVCAKFYDHDLLPTEAINCHSWENEKNFSELKSYDFERNNTGLLVFSSGTSGSPKGVMLTHNNLISSSEMLDQNVRFFPHLCIKSGQDTTAGILPFYLIYGFVATIMLRLKQGDKIITLPNFKPKTFLETIYSQKVTTLGLAPTLLVFLNTSDMVEAKHLQSVREIFCGAAPFGTKDCVNVMAKAPLVIFRTGYGLSETSTIALLSRLDSKFPESTGYPTTGSQVKVVAVGDPEFKAVGPNESGEIFIRGPHIMKGYLNNEKATQETLVSNNWLRTGDIGYYDDESKFFITDRLKELIKVKGQQVAPAELEEVLRAHPSIAAAAVIGVPHPTTGEVPRAFVVAKPNKTIQQDVVLKYLSEKLSRYKLPDRVVVVDSIPTSASGKILRRQIRLQFGTN